MVNVLIELVLFFILCYIMYILFVILRKKNNKFNPSKPKIEEGYLILKYKIDFNKFNKKEYKMFLNTVALTNSLMFSIILQLVQIVNGIFFQILLSFIFIIPFILIAYHIIGRHYQKKGMIKNV